MKDWAPEIEKQSQAEIIAVQEKKWQEALAYVNERSAFYKRLFKEHNINVSAIKTISDGTKLPTTCKDDLQHNNDAFRCVPKSAIVDYASTSGTLGTPVTFGLTDNDLNRLAYNEAISLACAGIKKGDVVQLITTIDRRFMAGVGFFFLSCPQCGEIGRGGGGDTQI